MLAARGIAPLLGGIAGCIKNEILGTLRGQGLPEPLESDTLAALSGPARVLPEGKLSPCAGMTYLCNASAAGEESNRVIPAVAAIEMLMAAGDLIDDIQDDEVSLPRDRRAVGRALATVSLLLMLAHLEVQSLANRGVSPPRVLRALHAFDRSGLDALKGQALDMELEEETGVSVDQAVNVSRLKSASMARCAAELGATIGTDDLDKIQLHAEFGWHFGVMVQLMNDIAAVWPGSKDKSDLRLRKKTLPIAFALNLPQHDIGYSRVVRSYYDAAGRNSPSEAEVRWALWRCGAIHFTWVTAAKEKAELERIARTLATGNLGDWPLARLLA